MVLSADDLYLKYGDYTDVRGKIRREVAAGNLIQIARGLYETDKNTDGKYLAGYIYGPSYLSFDYALAYYGLIPEAVYNTFTCATYSKNKRKSYANSFGTYTYRDVPKSAFSSGVNLFIENGYSYQLAAPEKAVCDKLYSLPPVGTLKALKQLLFDDLRIDETMLIKLDMQDIACLAPLYRAKNVSLFAKFMADINKRNGG